MYQKYHISQDFPARCGIRFDNESENREYKANYSYRKKLSVLENLREFDILLFCNAKVNFCIKPGTLPIREEIELRLVEMVDAIEEKDFLPSQTFKAVNDILFDVLRTL